MGFFIPGGRFKRFGDSLINNDTQSSIVPPTHPIVASSLGNIQSRIARARSVTAATDISRTAPTFNDPRYTFTTLSIPTDLRTLNGLYRFFDDTDPVVGNSLRLHVEFPLSRVALKDTGDSVINNHYHDMWNRIQMEKLLFDAGLEFWKIGNCFLYGAWNTDDHMWEQFVILNPDYVTVEGTYLNQKPFIKLQPDEHLKRVVTTGQPKFLYDQLPPEIIKYIRMGQEIPLSPNNTFHIAHNKAPYETLGRSIIKRILKSLIYEDRMSMANFAIATRQTIPITVVKLGDAASGWVPNDQELEDFRELLSAREVDPNFCYDEKTECLTDKGWVKYTELTYEHKIASFNSTTNKIEYHNPSFINIQDYDDDMIHFKSRKIDVKVTPNHRMWIQRDSKWQVILAEDVKETDVFRIIQNTKYKDLLTRIIKRVPYKGKIWCVTVPTGIIVTRREGCPIVCGQSIVYHWGIDIQFYGAGGKIWNLTNEFNRIMKWKLLGLGISENILTGGGSYASAYAQLEVLRQRYLHFQTTLQNFVYSGIFEPVASQCGFYKTNSITSGKYYTGKRFGSPKDELTKISQELTEHSKNFNNDDSQKYINNLLQKRAAESSKVEYVYPRLDWDLLSLSNDIQYKNFLMQFDRLFPGQRKISDQTFYMAARLDPEAEKAKIDKEFKESLENKLEKAKTIKEYKQKFLDAGLPIPLDLELAKPVPGAPGAPGAGGAIVPPGTAPQLGGTGGGNLPGAPALVPNAPIGKGQFEGVAPRIPRSPEAARLKSQQMHEHLTNAAIEIDKENQDEVLRLRKFNKEAGVPIDQIDKEAKINAESEKKEDSTESGS